MLNEAERFRVVKLCRICCILGLLPTDVDLRTWQLKVPSKMKRFLCFVSVFFFVLHTMYKMGSLAYVYLFDASVQIHHLITHAILVMVSTTTLFWYMQAYVSDPALYAKYFNVTLMGNIGGSFEQIGQLSKGSTRKQRQFDLQDFIALNLPVLFGLAETAIIAADVYDPSMKLLLHAALPKFLQTRAIFVLCLLEEVRFVFLVIAVLAPVWQLQVISYDLIVNLHQLLTRTMTVQNGRQSIRAVHRFLRTLQLYASMLNDINSYMVFTGKLLTMTLCIICGYAGVAHFREYPIFGIMYYTILVDAALSYTVVYHKAFKIPQLFKQATASALLRMRGKRRGLFWRHILSVPVTGIKVGSFHKMERASTPIFVDFVLKNIVNMLVAYG